MHGTYHPWLGSTHRSLATTAQWVEMQTPLFAGDACGFHEKVLAIIPEEGLVTSDFGLDIAWCASSGGSRSVHMLATPSAAATHLNSCHRGVHEQGGQAKGALVHDDVPGSFQKLKSYWKNFAPHECYSVRAHYGLSPPYRYSIDGDDRCARNYVLTEMASSARGHGSLSCKAWRPTLPGRNRGRKAFTSGQGTAARCRRDVRRPQRFT